MADREKVIRGLNDIHAVAAGVGTDQCYLNGIGIRQLRELIKEATELLKEDEPRVMTLEEVKEHYSLPPVSPDDLGMQEDYLLDIAPLYFDFSEPAPYDVHWRGANQMDLYFKKWEAYYGKSWRCWTARPTDEQREAATWD